MKRIALFPGTFDPFTIGHESIVRRGLSLVDEVVIAIGINDNKDAFFSLESRLQHIRALFVHEPRVRVESYDSLTVDFAKAINATFLLRGVRSVADFEMEKTIADVNRTLSGIETLLLITEPMLAHVSSSMVRELLRYGRDVGEFVPSGEKLKIITIDCDEDAKS